MMTTNGTIVVLVKVMVVKVVVVVVLVVVLPLHVLVVVVVVVVGVRWSRAYDHISRLKRSLSLTKDHMPIYLLIAKLYLQVKQVKK